MAKISVCIPAFNAENTLAMALESVYAQSFDDWEIVLVNDGSTGTDDKKRNCKKILKAFIKEHKIPRSKVKYLEHRNNLGLLEARRTAIESSEGDYIVILDSDDTLLPEALKILYDEAERTQADIVCGAELQKGEGLTLNGREVFDGFLVQHNHKGFLWGKIFKKSLYQKALSHIPFTKCTMAEDFLQYFFISYEAKLFVKIQTPVYDYNIGSGISTCKTIDSLSKWEQICTTATVFSVIFAVIKEENIVLSLEESEALKLQSRSYLADCLLQLKKKVPPALQDEARSLLCEYWGQDFVQIVEKTLKL